MTQKGRSDTGVPYSSARIGQVSRKMQTDTLTDRQTDGQTDRQTD